MAGRPNSMYEEGMIKLTIEARGQWNINDDSYKHLSSRGKKIVKNLIDIFKNRKKLTYPKQKHDAIVYLHHYRGKEKKIMESISKYYPEFWNYLKTQALNKKIAHRAEKAKQAEEHRLIQEERKKNPLLAKALDKIEDLEKKLESFSSSSGATCGCNCHNQSWGDYAPRR